jgi:hypothetical protein
MAKQRGAFQAQGSIGDVNFFKTQDGFLIRQHTGIDPQRIKTDPKFKRTRENGVEFGNAARAGKIIRDAFSSVFDSGSDNRVISRLVKELMGVLRSDTLHPRGKRTVADGDLTLLENFECNNTAPFAATCKALVTSALIDRVTGKTTLSLESFIPEKMIQAPPGATHFKVVVAAAAIDLVNETQTVDVQATPQILWDSATPLAPITLINTLPAASTLPLFLLAGIEFYQSLNGHAYVLNTGAVNALKIVKVSM